MIFGPCYDKAANLSERGSFLIAAFEFEDHSLNVLVILVRSKELQAFLWIAPFQNFDGLLTGAPRIHFALVCHVEINRVAS